MDGIAEEKRGSDVPGRRESALRKVDMKSRSGNSADRKDDGLAEEASEGLQFSTDRFLNRENRPGDFERYGSIRPDVLKALAQSNFSISILVRLAQFGPESLNDASGARPGGFNSDK
jgi:hypothetical protein